MWRMHWYISFWCYTVDLVPMSSTLSYIANKRCVNWFSPRAGFHHTTYNMYIGYHQITALELTYLSVSVYYSTKQSAEISLYRRLDMKRYCALIALDMREINLWVYKIRYTYSTCHLSDWKSWKDQPQVKTDKPGVSSPALHISRNSRWTVSLHMKDLFVISAVETEEIWPDF